MPSNPYKEQQLALAQLKKVAESCQKQKKPFNVNMVIIEALSTFAVSEGALRKYIDQLKCVYSDVRFEEIE